MKLAVYLHVTKAFMTVATAVSSHLRNVILDFRRGFVTSMTRLRQTLHD